ncbi:hypothetical protein AciM339_0197 [Aciduliprofundum sp. MAR08-339]|uniref:hypothetical protein n=1 Tax=Aciduliprofundum sp. (strain MAR08-339) TaxID=673860 RepID=UPI0002A495C1|nr:hypothetical protein AciM339_0197 [Aciduliprofundum sp. MAR08-339]
MNKIGALLIISFFVFSAFAIFGAGGAHAAITQSDILFEYDFYKGSSQQNGTEIIDASGNGNNGQIEGTPTWNNNSIHFDTGQRVVTNATLSTDYTIILDVSIPTLPSSLGSTISALQIKNSSGIIISVYFYTDNNLYVRYGSTGYNTNITVNVNTEYFIVLKQTSTYFSVSVNGNERNNLSAIATSGLYSFYIGCSPGTYDQSDVDYSFIAAYNRVLTSDEITDVQNQIGGQSSGGGNGGETTNALSVSWISGSPFTIGAGTEISATIAGQTQFVHPSVVYFPDNSPAGYHYVMAITPYPNTENQYENPSIAFSNDLVHWTEDGVSNPLVTPSELNMNYLSDPNLLYANGQFYLYFRGSSSNGTYIYLITSEDAHHWSQPQLVLTTDSLLSQSIIYDNGVFRMWGQSDVNGQRVIAYYTSTDGIHWTKVGTSAPVTVTYDNTTYQFWHLEVRKAGNKYYMLATFCQVGTSGGTPRANFWLESDDGLNWTGYSTPVQTNSNTLSTAGIYKSTFWIYDNTVNIIYSYMNSDGTWHIAYTSTAFTAPDTSNVISNSSSNNSGGGGDNGTGGNNGTTNGTGGAGMPTGNASAIWNILNTKITIGGYAVRVWMLLAAAVVVLLLVGRRR